MQSNNASDTATGRNRMLVAAAVFVVAAGAVLVFVSMGGESQPAVPIPEPVHLRVIVHAEDCTIEGPTQFRPGPITIDLVNENDQDGWFGLIVFDGDETIQDLMDEAGPLPSRRSRPNWAHDVLTPDPHALPGESVRWEGNLDKGDYALTCFTRIPPIDETTFRWPHAVVSMTALTVDK